MIFFNLEDHHHAIFSTIFFKGGCTAHAIRALLLTRHFLEYNIRGKHIFINGHGFARAKMFAGAFSISFKGGTEGIFGIIFPHVSTVEEARNAVSACRYPRLPASPLYHPPGVRGDAPARAARYWGLSQQEYYARADVWPLAPHGEILVIIQCEEMRAIENLPRMLQEVPGIGVVLIGEGDLSQELGHPRDYEHPVVADAIDSILKICQEHHVPCGHPHPDARNIERLIASGYRFLMPSAPRSFAVLEQGRRRAGRS